MEKEKEEAIDKLSPEERKIFDAIMRSFPATDWRGALMITP